MMLPKPANYELRTLLKRCIRASRTRLTHKEYGGRVGCWCRILPDLGRQSKALRVLFHRSLIPSGMPVR